jgi:DNA recombination protein RmuC
MLDLLALALAAFALLALAVVLLRRAPPPSVQDPPVGMLLEATRAQQQATQVLQSSLAEQGKQVAALQASLNAAVQGLGEVKQAQEAQRSSLGQGIQEAKQLLAQVQAQAVERAQHEQVARDSLARLEHVIAGTHSRGAAGENLLAEVLKQLPPALRAYDVRIGGKTVEFALPLPDGRFLPVDSKWTSVDKVAALATCAPEERPALVAALQKDVARKVEEVAKYLDPDKTCMMAVLAVPDAVYGLCAQAHVEAHRRGVAIVPYSMAVPYVLTTLQVIQRFGARVDEAQVGHMVRTLDQVLDAIGEEAEGRLSKGIAMLENTRGALRTHVGKGHQALGQVRIEVAPEDEVATGVSA